MNANQIRNIINNVKEQPYHTILINGTWGIGKTYEVLNSIKDKSDIYMVCNLRTIEKAQKFYQDVLGQIEIIEDTCIEFINFAAMKNMEVEKMRLALLQER